MAKLTNEQTKQIREYSEDMHKKNNIYHSFDHAERTVKLANILAEKENADKSICEAASFLHDIMHHKDKKSHPKLSAELAKKFLRRISVNDDTINKISHAIEHHASRTYPGAKTKEADILFDADHLQAMGPLGFCRDFSFCILDRHMDLIEAVKDTIPYVQSRLGELKTSTAKKLGKIPQKVMKDFYSEFNKWSKVDLK